MMKRILVVGGANGIGLSIATELAKKEFREPVLLPLFSCHQYLPDKRHFLIQAS